MPTITSYLTSVQTLAGGTGTWATATVAQLNSDNAAYAVWTKPSGTGQTSPGVEAWGFDVSAIPAGSTINSVTLEVNAFVSNTSRQAAFTYEFWDGTTARIGNIATGTNTTSTTNVDSEVPGAAITQAQLSTLRIRVYGHGGGTSTSGTSSVDYIRIVVDYTPPMKSGAASGSYTWAGSATGQQPVSMHAGAASGSYAFTGAAIGTQPGASNPVTMLIVGDTQLDGGSGTNTRATDCLNLVRATTHDYVLHTGDVCNNWLTSEISDADARFKVGGTPQPWTEAKFSLGNHEYDYNWPDGYDWMPAAGKGPSSSVPWYSFDTSNGWHIAVLDLAPTSPHSLAAGQPQYIWLDGDLTDHSTMPTIVLGHWGRYSGCDAHGPNTGMTAMWAMMMSHGNVEALLSGHQHQCERFVRMNSTDSANSTDGIMQFTCPATGQTDSGITNTTSPRPTFYDDPAKVGILRLVLDTDHFDWDWVVPGGYSTITDSGTQSTKVSGGAPAVLDGIWGYELALGQPAGTPPTVRSVGSTVAVTSANVTYTVPMATHNAGDLLMVSICLNGNATANIPAPVGWNRVWASATDGGSQGGTNRTTYESLYVFWRAADGSEGASQVFTSDVAVTGSGCMMAIQDADTTSPFDGAVGLENPSQAAHTISLTTTGGHRLLYSTLAEDSSSTVVTVPSNDGGWTSRYNIASGQTVAAATKNDMPAATYSVNWTLAAAKNAGVWAAGIKGV